MKTKRSVWLSSGTVLGLSVLLIPQISGAAQPPGVTAPTAIPASTISPSPTQLVELRQIVRTDATARAMFEKLQSGARAALSETPDPIALIQTEGKLQQDPLKIATQRSLRDMGKINALAWTYALGDHTATDLNAAKAKEFILAWADTNRSKGDPIDDTNLEPLLVGYDLTRGVFSAAEQDRVESYLRQVAGEEIKTGKRNTMTSRNNWNSHRLKIVGMIAFLLHDREMIDDVVKGYQKQVEQNLRPDGSSLDFEERDALHYHLYDLEPLLALAIAARRNGIDLYSYVSPSGASLPKSVQWLIPFCDGTKTHAEFVKSKVAFDRKRADSGDPHYKSGRLFEPKEALGTLALAAAFDPQCGVLERTVAGKPGVTYVSWQDVLNGADRPSP